MASVAVTRETVFVIGDRKRVIGTITLTGSYTTGGETVTAATLGLELSLDDLELEAAVVTGGLFATRWDKANSKVLLFANSDGTAAVNEPLPQLGAVAIPGGPASIRFRAVGKGSAA